MTGSFGSAEGFSADGYIIDQDYFAAYPYRTMPSSVNGCGWIAAYDLRRALGQAVDFNDVRAELDAMIRPRVPGPTPTAVLRRYLERYASLRFVSGREAVLSAACASRAGILRYREEGVPHFVAYTALPDGRFRFFNVADGLEDFAAPMEEFIRTRCGRAVRALTAPAGQDA